MRLPEVTEQYDAPQERRRNLLIEQEDRRNRKRGADINLDQEKLTLRSPDGTRWQLTVDNSGALSAQAV